GARRARAVARPHRVRRARRRPQSRRRGARGRAAPRLVRRARPSALLHDGRSPSARARAPSVRPLLRRNDRGHPLGRPRATRQEEEPLPLAVPFVLAVFGVLLVFLVLLAVARALLVVVAATVAGGEDCAVRRAAGA